MAAPKKGLGSKGLGIEALIHHQMNDWNELEKDGIMELDMNKIEPNRHQPRKHFDEEGLEELAVSIREYGIIQPILVQQIEDYYQIIAGERRWRASKIAGLKKIPAIVRECNEKSSSFELALVENLQREDLNPIEEAESYRYLCEEFCLSQEEVADKVGKSRSAITNALRLLNLDRRVLNFVAENKLSSGHARTLLSLEDGNLQFELAEKIIEDGLSVRNVEMLVKKEKSMERSMEKSMDKKQSPIFYTEGYASLESELKSIFGTKVKLSAKKNKGKIEIEYYSDEDLDRLIGMMKNLG